MGTIFFSFHICLIFLPLSSLMYMFSLKWWALCPPRTRLSQSHWIEENAKQNMTITIAVVLGFLVLFSYMTPHVKTAKKPQVLPQKSKGRLDHHLTRWHSILNFTSWALLVALFKALLFANTSFERWETHPSWYEIGSVAWGTGIIIRGVYINWKPLPFSKLSPVVGMLK